MSTSKDNVHKTNPHNIANEETETRLPENVCIGGW
jgi:hypothetical protein